MNYTIIGGTGDLGFGLALRLANAGCKVIIGSRSQDKAKVAADKIREKTETENISGMLNPDAAEQGDIVIIAVPSAAHKDILNSIKPFVTHKIILDVTVPLSPENPTRYSPPDAGSNAEEAQLILGENAKVVTGFHTISAVLLKDLDKDIEGDVLVAGNNLEAKETIADMASKIGLRSFDTGSLYQAKILEGLTPIIISLNKRYKRRYIGIKLTGI